MTHAGTDCTTAVFDRVVVGVDASPESEIAVAQALLLRAPGGTLDAVAAVERGAAVQTGWNATRLAAELEQEAEAALARVAALDPAAATHLVTGSPLRSLVAGIKRSQATLVAVGSHGTHRAVGIALGSVATMLLHDARCSVLVARRPDVGSIVCGIDGSPESLLALAAAEDAAARTGAALTVLTALGGKDVDLDAARAARPGLTEVEAKPVAALVDAAAEADLLVVGSRGLHGLKALGSVSERVAHSAQASVLVVRAPRP